MLGATNSLWVFNPKSPWSSDGDAIAEDHAEGYLGKAEDYIPKDWNQATGNRP